MEEFKKDDCNIYCFRCGKKKFWATLWLDGQKMEYPICECEVHKEEPQGVA